MIINKMGASTPFLFTGSAYMKDDLEDCLDTLSSLNTRFKGNQVIPKSLRPLIFGVVGFEEKVKSVSSVLT